MDQFLISGASDYGQYHCRREDSCRTTVFIYRNVCFLLYADGETGNGTIRPLHHCGFWYRTARLLFFKSARPQYTHTHLTLLLPDLLRDWIVRGYFNQRREVISCGSVCICVCLGERGLVLATLTARSPICIHINSVWE